MPDKRTTAERIRARSNGRPRPQTAEEAVRYAEEQAGVEEPPPHVETFTAADLMKLELPEPRYAVDGIVQEGFNILAGKPKLGKSWMALNIALAVAMGGVALGSIAVEEGDVLYLALEDTMRRLQDRLNKLLRSQNAAPPERLTLATHWPRQDKGGLAAVEHWLTAHKVARLVIVDTWPKFKPRTLTRGGNDYETDYAHAGELKAVADKAGVSTLAVAHCRKMGAADPVEEIMGTMGLSGAADGLLVLRRDRGQHDAALHITGRDVEERELALSWQPEYAQWSIVGEAEECRMSKERAEVVALLRKTGRPMRPAEAAPLLDKTPNATKKLFWSMAEAGQLQALGAGLYTVSGNSGNRSNAGNSGNRSNPAVTDEEEGGNRSGNRDDGPDYRFPQ